MGDYPKVWKVSTKLTYWNHTSLTSLNTIKRWTVSVSEECCSLMESLISGREGSVTRRDILTPSQMNTQPSDKEPLLSLHKQVYPPSRAESMGSLQDLALDHHPASHEALPKEEVVGDPTTKHTSTLNILGLLSSRNTLLVNIPRGLGFGVWGLGFGVW